MPSLYSVAPSITFQIVDQAAGAVLDPKDFRTDRTTSSVLSRATSLSSSPPSPFIAYHPDFQRLFQPTSAPSLEVIAQDDQDTQPFHEAGIWSERTQSVWFTSNRRLGRDGKAYTTASRMRLSSVGDGVERDSVNARLWEEFQHDDGALPTPNGGTILPNGNLLFCDQGYQTSTPSSLVVVDPAGETRPQVILNNYHGLPFNSLNDVVVYPSTPSSSLSCTSSLSSPPDFAQHGLSPTQTILFTDPCYGSEQGFKPPPVLPNQVYAFDPTTGSTWVIADGFDKPNGIVVDEVRGRCYITDTGFIRGCGTLDGARPSAIYAFDLETKDERGQGIPLRLKNRHLFAFVDCGAPDGIKLDQEGNVFAGCFDGVHVWAPTGALLGKILLTDATGHHVGCANLCFVPGGLICLAENRMFLVNGLKVQGALL